ncbi:hypothetical protein IG631_16712 [Alternaria alternata]|nr:hypothetical protein IG631_16712 [Alternaria alternata]
MARGNHAQEYLGYRQSLSCNYSWDGMQQHARRRSVRRDGRRQFVGLAALSDTNAYARMMQHIDGPWAID